MPKANLTQVRTVQLIQERASLGRVIA